MTQHDGPVEAECAHLRHDVGVAEAHADDPHQNLIGPDLIERDGFHTEFRSGTIHDRCCNFHAFLTHN